MPEELGPGQFSAAAAWQDIVELAIREKVELLLIAGDLVEWDNRFFEACGPLEEGLRRLAEAGVETCAVAGNHDVEALPRLADTLQPEGFSLLGRGGTWEAVTLPREGRPVLRLYGWSFPRREVRESPLADFPPLEDDGVPALAMLHADVDQPGSPYAPVSRTELDQHACALWLVGHVHGPVNEVLPRGGRLLYPGSPLALDPGETGCHGPWLLEVADGAVGEPEQVALSRTRYEQVEVSLGGVADEAAFQTQVLGELRRELDDRIRDPGKLELVCCRLAFTGRTKLHREVARLAQGLATDLRLPVHDATAIVEKVECRTQPDLDLAALAGDASPLALLARLLLELESGQLGEAGAAVVRQAAQRMEAVHGARQYLDLAAEPRPGHGESTARLVQAGVSLLDALHAQKQAP